VKQLKRNDQNEEWNKASLKLKEAVVTLSDILSYVEKEKIGKIHYLRGRALYLIEEYSFALGDLTKAKELFSE